MESSLFFLLPNQQPLAIFIVSTLACILPGIDSAYKCILNSSPACSEQDGDIHFNSAFLHSFVALFI